MRQLPLFFASSVLLLLLCSRCATLTVPVTFPNVSLTLLKGNPNVPSSFANYALVEHFFGTDETDISKATWDAESSGQVCMTLTDWGSINKAVAALCSQIECDEGTFSLLTALNSRLTGAAFKANLR